MVLSELPVPGDLTYLDKSKARTNCTYSRVGYGNLEILLSSIILSLLSHSLWETARYRLKYCLKRTLNQTY